MATALVLGLWLAAIAGKLAVLIFAVVRRIPAPVFILFFLAHTARSIYMLAFLKGKAYTEFRLLTAPWFDGFAALVAVEAFVLMCWKLPRFRWPGASIFAVVSVFGAMVAAAGGFVFPWELQDQRQTIAALERTTGLMLAASLGVGILVLERFQAVDRGTLHHAASIALSGLAAAAAYVLTERYSPFVGSIVSTGGGLLSYVLWVLTVKRMDLSKVEPGPPVSKDEAERAWGAGA